MAELRWGAATDAGQVRPENEDSHLASDGVFVVADGMGGHEAGEVASRLAVERIREALEEGDTAPTAERVVEAISSANGDIFRAAIANPGQAGMGTTVTVIAVIEDPLAGRGAPNIDENDPIETDPEGNPRTTPVTPAVQDEALVLANVGDSRTYLFRHHRLRRVTVDHSYVQELVASGHITDDEARSHPRRNIITRALGIEPDVQVDWWTLPMIKGDRFLLCSDGLVDEVTDPEITALLLAHPDDPQTAAEELVDMANEAGGRDNVTVVIVDVLDGDDPPDPTQEIDVVPHWADDETVAAPIPMTDLDGPVDEHGDPIDESTLSRRERRKLKRRRAALATAAAGDADGQRPEPASPRRRIVRWLIALVVVAAIVASLVAFGAWARRGYYVDVDDDDRVSVYQGRRGGVLWIEPTLESRGPDVEQFSDDAIEQIDEHPRFDTLSDAVDFVAGLELAEDATVPTATTSSDDEPATTDTATTDPDTTDPATTDTPTTDAGTTDAGTTTDPDTTSSS